MHYYSAPVGAAEYCDERVSLYVCLRSYYFSESTSPNHFTKFSVHLPMAVHGGSYSGGGAMLGTSGKFRFCG